MLTAKQFGVLATVALLVWSGVGCGDEDETGDSGGTGAAGSSSSSTGGTPDTPTCATYCKTVMKNCTSDLAVYVSEDVCMAVCESMPVGAAADTTGNTLGCRTYHSGAAEMAPEEHCPHAGPGGAGFCGSNCEGYCSLMMSACADQFENAADCKTQCEGLTDTEPFSANVKTGNTLQCRLYHASVATLDELHCLHANIPSDPEYCATP